MHIFKMLFCWVVSLCTHARFGETDNLKCHMSAYILVVKYEPSADFVTILVTQPHVL